jgi:hypothetical protein
VTTPGGVPNLPQGALTLATLASDLQDMTGTAMRSRAVQRFPSIFNTSTGLNPALDITPFGILTGIWAQVNSLIANADPADIQGPEDIPALLLQFIEGLPVVGQLVGLLEAILGTYAGDDPVLLEVQTIFAPIRAIVDALTAVSGGTGGLGNFFPNLLGLLGNPTGMGGTGTPTLPGVGAIPILGGLLSGGSILGSLIPGLDASKITSGTFAQSMITGLPSALAALVSGTSFQSLIDAMYQGIFGGTSTGNTAAAVQGGLAAFPGGNLVGSVASSLLSGVLSGGLIPSLDASKVTTGTFGTGLIPALPASQITSGTFASGRIPDITLGMSSAVQSVVDQAYQITQGGSSTGNSLTTFGPSFGGLLDNLTNNITGAPASGNRNTDMGAAVAGQTDTINGNAAAIAQMKAASGGGNTDSDDMERVSTTTMGANYLVLASAAGTLATPDGHNASFVGASATCDYVARKTNIKAATDTQTVTIILGSQCGALPLFISTAYGHVDLWLRMTAFTTWATRTGVRFRWGADGFITLHRVISGAETKMYPPSGNVSKGNPPNNAAISFSSGVGGVARHFTASLNGAVIMDFTETGTTSQLGVNNRFRGFGGRYEYTLPLVDGQPGKIAQWTASG